MHGERFSFVSLSLIPPFFKNIYLIICIYLHSSKNIHIQTQNKKKTKKKTKFQQTLLHTSNLFCCCCFSFHTNKNNSILLVTYCFEKNLNSNSLINHSAKTHSFVLLRLCYIFVIYYDFLCFAL